MPHLVLEGRLDLDRVAGDLETVVHRWGRAVLKVADGWVRADRRALLIEGVVVELARPLHPVAMVTDHEEDTIVRLWPVVSVERTPAVQRWLAMVASTLQDRGAGPVITTNLTPEALDGAPLRMAEG